MSKRSRYLYILLGVLALGTCARADLMPVCSSDDAARPPVPACVTTAGQEPGLTDPFQANGMSGLPSLPIASLPVADGDAAVTGEAMPPATILTDGQDSFSLCLYTLLGLGLCKSAPWVKRLHWGHIPHWYHDGGPFQIGHSHAISPDCSCHAAACFVQPDGTVDDPIPQYRFTAIVARWRQSQFTPAVRASRAPPRLS